MKRAVLAIVFVLTAAAPAPADLIAGSVRDQRGAPIAGASVALLGTNQRTTTDSEGTFALAGSRGNVQIRCAYCRTAVLPVASDGTVVAVIQRYDAVRLQQPDSADLAALPYARVESDLSLAPFVVLEQSRGPASSATLHDASVSTPGGLLVLDGIAAYDSVSAIPVFDSIPTHDATAIAAAPPSQGYAYGDLGTSGVFSVTTAGGDSSAQAGSNVAVRVGTSSESLQTSGAYARGDGGDQSSRATAQYDLTSGETRSRFVVTSGSDDDAGLSGSFSALQLHIERTQGIDSYATFTADRGTDDAPEFAQNWSDVQMSAGVRSDAAVAPFFEVSARDTHGWYASSLAQPYLAGTIDQARAYAGVTATGSWYAFTAAQGVDGVGYVTYTPDGYPSNAQGRDQSFNLDLHPGRWLLNISSTAGYAIEPLFDAYVTDVASPIDAMSQNMLAIGYGDQSRVRAQIVTAQTRSSSGIDDTANGVNVAWQLAPQISLRSWWLQTRTAAGAPEQSGSFWLTLTPGALRADVIWRRDILANAPDMHLDADISGPLTQHLQWFVNSERRVGVRSTNAGIRF
jgi:hypothetical protein